MKTLKVDPSLLDLLRDSLTAQPVLGLLLLVVLSGLFASWAR